jgi:hypothetical protein
MIDQGDVIGLKKAFLVEMTEIQAMSLPVS